MIEKKLQVVRLTQYLIPFFPVLVCDLTSRNNYRSVYTTWQQIRKVFRTVRTNLVHYIPDTRVFW